MDEIDEVLNIQQRQARKMIMRRYQNKIERAKELAQKRMAPEKNIKKRAYAEARQIVRRKFAGKKGAEYEKLGPSEKISIDRAIEKKQALIKKIALRLIPRVKAAEQKRLQSFVKGHALVNAGSPEGHTKVNERFMLFAEKFDTESEKAKLDTGPNDGKTKTTKSKSKNPEIKYYNKFGEQTIDALDRKSEKSGIDIEILGEVYNRGLDAWNDHPKVTCEQYAFARVNSFINKGKSYYSEDADLAEETVEEGKRGLWDNIHAKRERIKRGSGERMRKPGSEGAPTAKNFKDASESVEIDELSKTTIKSYLDKNEPSAEKAMKIVQSSAPEKKWNKALGTTLKRDAGERLASKKLAGKAKINATEETQIDELSTSTVNAARRGIEKKVAMSPLMNPAKKERHLKSFKTGTDKILGLAKVNATEETEIDEGVDKNHPIVKEYNALKKHDIKTLRNMISQHHKVVDTSEFKTKDHAVSHYLRQKHGHKKVDQAFGFNEETELDEAGSKYNIPMARPKAKSTPTRPFISVVDEVGVPAKHLDSARGIWNKTKDVEAVKKFVSSVKEETELQEAKPMGKKIATVNGFHIHDLGADTPHKSKRFLAYHHEYAFISHTAPTKTEINKKSKERAESKPTQKRTEHDDWRDDMKHRISSGEVRRAVMSRRGMSEEVEVEESNNTPYVKPHIEKGSTKQTAWKASNKHGRVKYFGMDFKKSAEKHAGISEEVEELDEGIKEKIKGAIRREKAKDLPLLQTRRDYAMGKTADAYEKGNPRKAAQYSAWAERDRKKMGHPTDNPAGTYRTKTTDYTKEEVEIDEAMTSWSGKGLLGKMRAANKAFKRGAAGWEKGTHDVSTVKAATKTLSPEQKTSTLNAKAGKGSPLELQQKLIKRDLRKEEVEIDEKLTSKTPMSTYIKDFQKSDAPQFKGKSLEKRRQMAIAAKLAKEECDCSDERKKIEAVDRPPATKGVRTKQGEIQKKIIDESKDLNESFNIALAAGVGVTLTAADLGMRAQGGFALHPSVIAEMEQRQIEEDAESALKKPVYMPPRRRQDGSYGPAKTVLRKTGKKIIDNTPQIDADSDPHDGQ